MHAEKDILRLGGNAEQSASQAEAGCIYCKNGDIVSGLAATEKSRVYPDVSIVARAGRESWRDLKRSPQEGKQTAKAKSEADLTSDKNFFIISSLCCNDSDDAKAKFAGVEGRNQ